MKPTGIVRRIDDLGRIVIPKEIRRTLRIRESDPLEIYTGAQGEVIFKKYSPVGELNAFAADYAEVLAPLLKAKARSVKGSSDYERSMKLVKYALGRGFDMQVIRRCLGEATVQDIDDYDS